MLDKPDGQHSSRAHDKTQRGEEPSTTKHIEQRLQDGNGAGRHDTATDTGRGGSRAGGIWVAVEEQGVGRGVEEAFQDTEKELKDDEHGIVDVILDGPSPTDEQGRQEGDENVAAAGTGALNGKVIEVVARGFVNGPAGFARDMAIVVVHGAGENDATGNDAEAAREVGEANLELVEGIDVFEDIGHGGLLDRVDGVIGDIDPEDSGGIAMKDDAQALQRIGDAYSCEQVAPSSLLYGRRRTSMAVSTDGPEAVFANIPPVTLAAITDDPTTGLGEEEDEEGQDEGADKDERPKDPVVAAAEIGDEAAHDGANAGAKVEGDGERAEHGAAMARGTGIGDDAIGDRLGGAGAQTLQGAEGQEGGETLCIEGEAEIGDEVEEDGDDEHGTTTEMIRQWAKYGGRDGLEDDVDGDAEVDGLGRSLKVFSQQRQQGKVDGDGERGGDGGKGEDEEEEAFVIAREEGVWRRRGRRRRGEVEGIWAGVLAGVWAGIWAGVLADSI